jgi:hypothetical protein
MPGYIQKKLQEYEHIHPKNPQYCPYSPKPKQFDSEAQWPLQTSQQPPQKTDPENFRERFVLKSLSLT